MLSKLAQCYNSAKSTTTINKGKTHIAYYRIVKIITMQFPVFVYHIVVFGVNNICRPFSYCHGLLHNTIKYNLLPLGKTVIKSHIINHKCNVQKEQFKCV